MNKEVPQQITNLHVHRGQTRSDVFSAIKAEHRNLVFPTVLGNTKWSECFFPQQSQRLIPPPKVDSQEEPGAPHVFDHAQVVVHYGRVFADTDG